MHDPTLLPDIKPENFSVNSLLSAVAEEMETDGKMMPSPKPPRVEAAARAAARAEPMRLEAAVKNAAIAEPARPGSPIFTPTYEGPDRRLDGPERRNFAEPRFGADRRANPFGRRRTDTPHFSDVDGIK